jgi:hypothetical protein
MQCTIYFIWWQKVKAKVSSSVSQFEAAHTMDMKARLGERDRERGG